MQAALFPPPARVVSCPLCPWNRHCGAQADVGPCEPRAVGCNHTLTCQRCGAQGVESWSFKAGRAAHDRVYQA